MHQFDYKKFTSTMYLWDKILFRQYSLFWNFNQKNKHFFGQVLFEKRNVEKFSSIFTPNVCAPNSWQEMHLFFLE